MLYSITQAKEAADTITEHLNVGAIGIFQKANNIYIKKVGETGLISLNPKYPGLTADGDRILVLGKVLGKAENN